MPRPASVVIDRVKIERYLLNVHHPVGGSKAAFFIGWGFSPSAPDLLAAALLDHTLTAIPRPLVPTPWGHRFLYEGPLASPKGATPPVLSVWQHDEGPNEAKLVTARPI